MIEIATGVRERYDPLLAELRQMQGLLLRARDWLNIVLCGGVHIDLRCGQSGGSFENQGSKKFQLSAQWSRTIHALMGAL